MNDATKPPAETPIEVNVLAVARAFATDRGWTWLEPIEVRLAKRSGVREWLVVTNVHSRGTNITIVVRESDLAVIRSGFARR